MKTLKKISASLFALVLCVSLLATPFSALAASGGQTGTYVFDEQGLFTSSEFDTLEAKAVDLADKYGMGVYLLTTDYMNGLSNPTSSERTSYATAYYKEHKLGLNPGSNGYGDGIMLVVAAKSRDYVTIAYGQGSYSFNDAGIGKIEDVATGRLSDNDWYGAAVAYYDNVGSQLEYYAKHGSAQTPLDMGDYILIAAIVLGVPALVASFSVRRRKAAMKTAVEQSEAGNYLDASSLNVTVSSDQFVNTTLVATPKPKHNDSGGGGWGGGGGGGFSSSGGGKF